jgi:hypothetical protein
MLYIFFCYVCKVLVFNEFPYKPMIARFLRCGYKKRFCSFPFFIQKSGKNFHRIAGVSRW